MRVPYTRIMQAMVTQNVRRPQGHENYVSGTPGAMVIVYLRVFIERSWSRAIYHCPLLLNRFTILLKIPLKDDILEQVLANFWLRNR